MKYTILDKKKIDRLETFIAKVYRDATTESKSIGRTKHLENILDYLDENYPLTFKGRILNVGCGRGETMEEFRARSMESVGVSLDPGELEICRQKGLTVYCMDQSFLEFEDESFDSLWCEHCIEQSIFPYYTLSEFYRVIKPGGICYIEVPAPDTCCHHQNDKQNYSVFGKSMWSSLMLRTGFVGEAIDIDINLANARQDLHWGFVLVKK